MRVESPPRRRGQDSAALTFHFFLKEKFSSLHLSFDPTSLAFERRALENELSVKTNSRALDLEGKGFVVVGGQSEHREEPLSKVQSDLFYVLSPALEVLQVGRLRNKLSKAGLALLGTKLVVLGGQQDFCEDASYNCVLQARRVEADSGSALAFDARRIEYFGTHRENHECSTAFFFGGQIWGIDQNCNFFKGDARSGGKWQRAYSRSVRLGRPSGICAVPRRHAFVLLAGKRAFLFEMDSQRILFLMESFGGAKLVAAKFLGCARRFGALHRILLKRRAERLARPRQRFRVIEGSCESSVLVVIDERMCVYYYDLNLQSILFAFNASQAEFSLPPGAPKPLESHCIFDVFEANAADERSLCFARETVNLDDPSYAQVPECPHCPEQQREDAPSGAPQILGRLLGPSKYPCLATLFADSSVRTEPVLLCGLHHRMGFQSTSVALGPDLLLLMNMGLFLLFSCEHRRIVDYFERRDFFSHPLLPCVVSGAALNSGSEARVFLLGSAFSETDSFEEISVSENRIRARPLQAPQTRGRGAVFAFGKSVYLLAEDGRVLRFREGANAWEPTIVRIQFEECSARLSFAGGAESGGGGAGDFILPFVLKTSATRFRMSGIWTNEFVECDSVLDFEFSGKVDNFAIAFGEKAPGGGPADAQRRRADDFELGPGELPLHSKLDPFNVDSNVLKFGGELLKVSSQFVSLSRDLRETEFVALRSGDEMRGELDALGASATGALFLSVFFDKGLRCFEHTGVHLIK